MISTRRKPFPIGKSQGVTLPASMQIAAEVSVAAGERLVIMDTTGEVPEDKLLQFYVQYVEPAFQEWWQSQKRAAAPAGGVRGQQAQAPAPARPVKRPEPVVVKPSARIRPVVCPRCEGHITWTVEQGLEGFCPYCGLYLHLTPG